MTQRIRQTYSLARERYLEIGVDTDVALQALSSIPIALHCWQGDDVGGFESAGASLHNGGIQVTGNYPGKARTLEELRADLDQVFKLLPGKHRLNLHAIYGDFSGKTVERDAIAPAHFQSWIDWAKARGLHGLDFNPSYFAHPLANNGATLTHRDNQVRQFWIDHGVACRRIGAAMGRQLGTKTITNIWVPDGMKDSPANRKGPRQLLEQSLDAIFADPIDTQHHLDAVESKLFGIGSESFVPGSHEFYLGYAIKNQKVLCLDAGHFHPTETLADKISSTLQFVPEIILHVSRGVRWDSDHVVLFDDPTRATMEEIIRGEFITRTRIGLDFFDASINRIAAWVIGARATLKCLLYALLEPASKLCELEASGDLTARLAWMEEIKALPFGAVWDEHCRRHDVPEGAAWLDVVRDYEKSALSRRA
jgi:L-rhamnose isomerase